MALSVVNPVVTDALELTGIEGYDLGFISLITTQVTATNKPFSIFNSAGTAVKTIYFWS